MDKPLLVIVEEDESYLSPLEIRIAEIVGDAADIEVISDTDYFEEFFLTPKKIDVLIIDEDKFEERLLKHDIDNIYILTEKLLEQDKYAYQHEEYDNILCLYKILNVDRIIDKAIPFSWRKQQGSQIKPKLVAVISASGGVGCTSVAMGICACMKYNLKQACYINPQMYQNFHYFLKEKKYLNVNEYMYLQRSDVHVFSMLDKTFQEEGFSYFPPLKSSRESLGISVEAYHHLINGACQSGKYDFVVVDIGTELSLENLSIVSDADKVFIVSEQDDFSAFKLNVLKRNVSCNDPQKYIFLCNKFEKEQYNAFVSGEYDINISEYIARDSCICEADIQTLSEIDSFQRISYILV